MTLNLQKQRLIEQELRNGKTYKQIASEHRLSFRDIARVAKEMGRPSAFDVFDMVLLGKTPRQIAEETGAGFDDVKKLFQDSVELLELMVRQAEALRNLEPTELYKKLRELKVDAQASSE